MSGYARWASIPRRFREVFASPAHVTRPGGLGWMRCRKVCYNIGRKIHARRGVFTMQPSTAVLPPEDSDDLPDHTQLPDKDGSIVTNFQEPPQSVLLSSCLKPRLRQLHPEGDFIIGQDNGIYWRHTNPPLDGCKSPDWYYVPGVPPMLKGKIRRSYVLWKEHVPPLIAIEYVSGNGREERDDTPNTGKFWVYEQGICIPYYLIFNGFRATIDLFSLRDGRYEPVPANAAGRYPVAPLGVEFGLRRAHFDGMTGYWLRAWDSASGEMISCAEERDEASEILLQAKSAKLAAMRAETEAIIARTEAMRAQTKAIHVNALQSQLEKLHERLRAMGLDPDALP